VAAFSKDGKLLATGSTDGKLAVLKYPSLDIAFPPVNFNKQEIYDLDFDSTGNQARYEFFDFKLSNISIVC
jgi:prolactin regulatory element-binding protein